MSAEVDLRSAHLRLRELRPADQDAYCAIYTSPVLTRFLGVDRCTPEKAATSFRSALAQRNAPSRRRYTLAITAPDGDTMHGIIGLLVEDYGSNAMITGLVIRPGTPVAGYGAQAGRMLMAHGFGPLGLHRIWAGHRSDHHRMREVMLDAGFHPEATLRELFHTAGRWHDVTTYAAVSHRWRHTATPAERAILDATTTPVPAQQQLQQELGDVFAVAASGSAS
jgi:[ribosomal protein S5]-alanine N-acetyltransferase